MIRLVKGGIVREVQSQREVDYYAKLGYEPAPLEGKTENFLENLSGEDAATPPAEADDSPAAEAADKKPGKAGKKDAPKEE